MDLEALAETGTVALLTLPLSDLLDRPKPRSSSSSAAATSSSASVSANETSSGTCATNDDGSPPLLLMQLPSGWRPRDLKSSHFVSQGPSSSVSLVCESQNASFAVHLCETSNVLVLVPPPSSAPPTSAPSSSTEAAGSFVNKRRKVVTTEGSAGATTTTVLEETPARLLRTSGASFLELRPQTLSRQALRQALGTHNPVVAASGSSSAAAGRGRSVSELANHLQVSTSEVRRGLRDVGAFCCERPDLYVLLSDQTTFECNQLVVSALGERHIDYSASYSLNEMTAFVVDRMSDEERFESKDRVIRFCLLQLSDEANSYEDDRLEECSLVDHDIRFSLSKVAACVARHLFILQSEPWEETLFFSRWQGLLPGDGMVDAAMLRGVAVPISREDETSSSPGANVEVFWKYLPVEGLSQNVREGIDELFRSKSKWTRDELEPYLQRYVSGDTSTNKSVADLLLRYTKVVEEAVPGQATPASFHVLR